MELVGRVAFFAARLRPFLPTYLHLLASALFPIYVGAHASLAIPTSAAPPAKKRWGAHDDDDTEEVPEVVAEKVEGLTPKDAVLFPLLAGFTLSSLYFIIKWLEDPSVLNKILSYYFMQVGLVFGTKFLKDAFAIVRSVCLPNQYEQGGQVWKVNRLKQRYEAMNVKSDTHQAYRTSPLPGLFQRLPVPKIVVNQIWQVRALVYAKCSLNFHIHKLLKIQVPVDFLDALAISASSAIVGYFTFFSKPWYLSNLLGFAFCYGSTQYMSPTTFWTGTLLLSALFLYDIYFVFFTPMMVTVATKLDIPIKLLFPRPSSPAEVEKGVHGLAMLGLGDIVIPGMMIALALRFDLYLHYLRKSKVTGRKTEKANYIPVTGGWGERFWVGRSAAGPDLRAKTFPKTYFKAGLFGYTSGMMVTLLVMQIADHAQPALLYLVPGVLAALWGTAAVKGDLDQMWHYTEDREETKDERSSEQNRKKATKASKGVEGNKSGEEGSENREPTKNDEPAATSTATGPDLDSTSDTEADSQTSSDSKSDSDAGSDSDANSNTPSSTQSEDKKESKHLKSKASDISKQEKKDEEKCRHLIWFSIDFPPSPAATEEAAATKSDLGAQLSSRASVDSAVDGDRQPKGVEKPTNGVVGPLDGEPPGKRRRVA